MKKTSPKPPRKTTRERALEACRAAMTLQSEVAKAIAAAELLQPSGGAPNDPAIEAHLEAAQQAVTVDFVTAIAMAGGQPSGTGKDLQFWKNVIAALQAAKDRVAAAVVLINSAKNQPAIPDLLG